eukprot:365193-Chlamydomonas_euryale.AAC.6
MCHTYKRERVNDIRGKIYCCSYFGFGRLYVEAAQRPEVWTQKWLYILVTHVWSQRQLPHDISFLTLSSTALQAKYSQNCEALQPTLG